MTCRMLVRFCAIHVRKLHSVTIGAATMETRGPVPNFWIVCLQFSACRELQTCKSRAYGPNFHRNFKISPGENSPGCEPMVWWYGEWSWSLGSCDKNGRRSNSFRKDSAPHLYKKLKTFPEPLVSWEAITRPISYSVDAFSVSNLGFSVPQFLDRGCAPETADRNVAVGGYGGVSPVETVVVRLPMIAEPLRRDLSVDADIKRLQDVGAGTQ